MGASVEIRFPFESERRARQQRKRRRPWRLVAAIAASWLILAHAGGVAASAWSAQTYETTYDPYGAEPNTDYCSRAGIVDTARNYAQVLAYLAGGSDCIGTTNQLPSGWIGVEALGYLNGSLCASSGFYYSTQAASNWQLYITLCSNPAGSQSFRTASIISFYDGTSGYRNYVGATSPTQSY